MYRMTPVLLLVAILACGCGSVQRELTVKTEPAGALVLLNDEEIGTSPVTASFNWYGDYRVTISHEGYATLITHKKLAAPWYDYFPFDLARLLWPAKTTDRYEWTFKLQEPETPTREQLIKSAVDLRQDHTSHTQPDQ
jgi:hypothetical protein